MYALRAYISKIYNKIMVSQRKNIYIYNYAYLGIFEQINVFYAYLNK